MKRDLNIPLPEAPEWLFAKTATEKTPMADIYDAKTGSRNESLTRLVGSFLNDHKGLTLPELIDMACLWNKGLSNSLPLEEVERTCKSIFDRHHSEDPERQERRQVKAIDIADFLSLEFPPRENILDPWLPMQGLCMVHAPRGIGKTFLGLNIAVAVTSRGQFLRWRAPKERGVLLLDGEMPGIVLQERLSYIIASVDEEPTAPLTIITPDLQPSGMPNLIELEGQEAIEPYLKDISLVIVDNISTLCRGGRENEGESWLPVQEWALKLRSRGISVLFIHHSGKGGQQRGTSRREDVLDTVISLKHPAEYRPDMGACFEVHFEKSRGIYGDVVKPFEAKMETHGGKYIWTLKDLEESLTDKVAELMKEGIPQHEIAELLGKAKGTISKHVKKAKMNGVS